MLAVNVLSVLLISCIPLSVLAVFVHRGLKERRTRLVIDWWEMCQENTRVCGDPGRVELADFPGIAENCRNLKILDACWCFLLAVATATAFVLALVALLLALMV